MKESVREIDKAFESPANEVKERGIRERENLGIGLEQNPEFVLNSDIEDKDKILEQDAAGEYNALLGKVVIDGSSTRKAGEVGARELEHARQSFRYAGFGFAPIDHQTLEESGLIQVTDTTVKKTELLRDLDKLGFSPDSLGQLISENPNLKKHLDCISRVHPGGRKAISRKIDRVFKEVNSDGHMEDSNDGAGIDYTDERLEYLLEIVENIESTAPEEGVMRTDDGVIRAEKQGFAHFISAYLSQDQRELEAAVEEEIERLKESGLNEDTIWEMGVSVGERAAERLEELYLKTDDSSSVYHNLVEHGEMSEEEAVRYILGRVQDRKVEYAAEMMEDYTSVEDIEKALSV